jgi:hypothetical protein
MVPNKAFGLTKSASRKVQVSSGLANDSRTLEIAGEKATTRGVWQAILDSEHHPE